MGSVVSIAQFSKYVKSIFDNEMLLQNITLYGEVSSYNVSNNIAYFTLKDSEAILSCVGFGADRLGKVNIGDVVMATGSPNYYVKGGRFSFNVVKIEPYGKGKLYEQFLELKERLQAKGYFDEVIKKPLPRYIRRIGVVTSPTGAVIQDIINVTTRRNKTIDVVLYPVKVQGIGAENEIAKGIDFFSNYDDVDLVIVARGGGSIEDLQPFNTEIVANAIHRSNKMIVSAVGHETDFTICDFTADLREPTPSAGAEIVSWDLGQFKSKLYAYVDNMEAKVEKNLNGKMDIVCGLADTMQDNIKSRILGLNNDVLSTMQKINYCIDKSILNYSHKLELVTHKIEFCYPKSIYEKGYSKVFKNGKLIKNCNDLKSGDEIDIDMIGGQINAKVKE